MTIGSLLVVSDLYAADTKYSYIVCYSYVMFLLVSLVLRRRFAKSEDLTPRAYAPAMRTLIWYLVSATIVLAYMSTVGYSAFVLGLQGSYAESAVDVATLRLESYSGARYLAPGYVNQFKNSLLPILTCIYATYLWRRKFAGRLAVMALGGFAGLALLWTGQRTALFIFVLILMVYVLSRHRVRQGLRRTIAVGAIGVTLLVAATIVLGRGSLRHASGLDAMTGALFGLIERLGVIGQTSGVVAFRYTEARPLERFGGEWIQAFSGLFPGQGGSTLATEVFAYRYGTDRGTSPPSVWGDVHYNFGLVGSLLFPILLALVYGLISRVFVRDMARWSGVERLGAAGVAVVLGSWVAGSPVYLLNFGLVVYVALWLLPRIFVRIPNVLRVQPDSRLELA